MTTKTIIRNGLWDNNPALIQLLGLCPMLAVSNTTINALGMGLATTLTLLSTNLIVSLIRHWVRPEIRIPVFVLIIAAVVTAIELFMNAFFHQLYLILGVFIPLITTNCIIIARAESFASKNNPLDSSLDGLFMGLGFTAVLVILGAIREVIGFGTFLQQADLMFGAGSEWLTVTVFDGGFLLAIFAPGAFIGLGLLVALKNLIDNYQKTKSTKSIKVSITPSVTESI
ncbi:Electron transport complex protein RnfE [hydrothermal vent metagenome]|uniref:Electron transport complex protein RnfE n=1 Tax=hydrothermal vent metagenome TaxID=652676 RepID=A0A3B0ZVJ4_9ZZZZ